MPILNFTTTITPEKSVGEIGAKLAKAGAKTVSTVFEAGAPTGVHFTINTQFGERSFTLPTNPEGVYQALRKSAPPRYRSRDQAQRVAWRILKDWIEAQLALIEAGMSTLDEVMLPYMLMGKDQTVAQIYRTNQLAALGSAQ